jgi:phosphoesterase RecJ-like protein
MSTEYITCKEIAIELKKAKKVLITTHVRPDGDAVGSTTALSLALQNIGIHAEILYLSSVPEKYAFMCIQNNLKYHEGGISADNKVVLPSLATDFDTVVIVDTGTWSQLPGLKDFLFIGEEKKNKNQKIFVVDHHITQDNFADCAYVKKESASCAELFFELARELGAIISPAIATSVFVGLVSDTGWLKYPSVSVETLRHAADLIEAGAPAGDLYEQLYLEEKPERLFMLKYLLSSLQFLHEKKVALMSLTQKDFEHAGATDEDSVGWVNMPLDIKTVKLSIVLTEQNDGTVKMSCRSKKGVDAALFCQQFGGGGHARAAGARMQVGLEDAVKKITETVGQFVQ